MLGIRIDAKLEKELVRYARKTGQPKSKCVKEALREFFWNKSVEKNHDVRTLMGWRQIEMGCGVSMSEIFAYLDKWGADEEI